MNELLKIEVNEEQEPCISGRELHEFLIKIDSFHEFFVAVSKLKTELDREGLGVLLEELDQLIYVIKFGGEEIAYLKDSVVAERVLPCKAKNERKYREKEMQNYIENNFKSIFPDYDFVSKEKAVKGVGRIDIFARERKTGRPVIIELKKGSRNPNIQLLAYAKSFDNPILVAITEDIANMTDGIEYVLFEEVLL